MVNAFTFDNGSPRSFSSRAEMYDFMLENGHVVLEGDDAVKFRAHAEKRVADNKSALAPKAAAAIARMEVA